MGGLPVNTTHYESGAFGSQFQVSQAYLKDCILSLLQDIVSSMNFQLDSCCPWHGNLHEIGVLLEEMRSWHECDDGWPQGVAIWQCQNCSAVAGKAQPEDYCWICNENRE